MGIRGELFSSRVGCEGRTYFFNVKENRMGDMFLTVVESKPTETEGFERRSVVVFREDLSEFVKALQGALDFMSKPDGERPALKFSSEGGSAPKAGPSGFAGADSKAAAPGAEEAARPKRKIVVRRKAEPKDQA